MGPYRVLCRGFCAHLSGEPDGQEGRLQSVPGPERSEPRHQRQQFFLTADLCRISQAPVPAAQRLSGAKGYPQLRGAQRKDDGRQPVVLSHRSSGDNPEKVDHREPDDDGCL